MFEIVIRRFHGFSLPAATFRFVEYFYLFVIVSLLYIFNSGIYFHDFLVAREYGSDTRLVRYLYASEAGAASGTLAEARQRRAQPAAQTRAQPVALAAVAPFSR